MGAPIGQTWKRKSSTPHDQSVIDVDTWLQEARQASDSDAVQWFTHTMLHRATTMTQPCKRPRTLNALHNRWTTTLNYMEDLTRKHLRAMTHAYIYATTCAHTMKHLRDRSSLYGRAIKAKRCYHDVVSTQLRHEMSIILTHQIWQQYVVHTQETYYTAKQEALTSYMDSAYVVGLHTRYQRHRLQRCENRWLSCTQQVHDHAIRWTQRPDIQDYAERTKCAIYNTESSHLRRQLYLHRKRPRENWDPTLWEVPLLPLPKRHKTHWDPNECEVPCDAEPSNPQ